MPSSFSDLAKTLGPRIDAALDARTRLGDGCPARLQEAMRYSLLAPGKRMRPMLVLLAARACGGTVETAMPAACAVEMVHAYSLIHDDLPAMDDDDLRRGRPTCHKAFDEATAILAGDGLLTLAFEVLAREIEPPAVAAACCAALAHAAGACNMVGGQADDVRAEEQNDECRMMNDECPQDSDVANASSIHHSSFINHPSLAFLTSLHHRKTGAMIQVSLQLGAMIAGANPEQLAVLDTYGKCLGLAFQITDDLLDVRGVEVAMGKRVGKDAGRGKLTFPGVLGLDQSTQHARQWIAEACRSVADFGPQAEGLLVLAQYVLEKESLMDKLLSTIQSPADLKKLSHPELVQLAGEMREALCRLVSSRTAHFASNLGVVELTLALHTTFDFSRDRLIWDIGHQVYAHKMVTGRYDEFQTIRTKGGLMGYPNPAESDYDLFMTGHAGCSIGTVLGMRCGDDLLRPEEGRLSVAVVGDGAFSNGMIFEAMNNAGGLKKNLIVILNDNKMSICPRVGGLAESLDRLRTAHFYTGLKLEVQKLLNRTPVIGEPVERFLTQVKDALKAGLLGGMIFEDLGFRYIGPVDGHNIRQLQKYLQMVRQVQGPVLLHVVTEKGHGFQPAAEDPTTFHAPDPFQHENGSVVPLRKTSGKPSYTQLIRDAIQERMRANPKVVAITAAMCQGTMLEPIREEFPNRFFDVGICESHAVAFAAGLAKAGLRPIVDIYSTFLQRSYDQLFQEVALQNLPVTLLLDRAGLVGPDGPTHHGVFDLTYLRPLPNMTVLAPGDALDVAPMVAWALGHDGPVAIRYPKAVVETVARPAAPIELGKAEVLRWGRDGMLIACGTTLASCVKAAGQLAADGLDFGVLSARFVKPLDATTILRAVRECPVVVTVEEGILMGGFGSAVLEAAADAGLNTSHIRRLGIPDQFIEHGARGELLADVGLDVAGIVRACRSARPAAVKKPRPAIVAL